MTTAPPAREPTVPPWRMSQWPGRLLDLGVVAALLLVGGAIVAGSAHEFPRVSVARVPWYLVVAVALGAILLRRRTPRVSLGLVLAAVLAEGVLRSPIVVQPMVLVVVYTVAARLPWRQSLPLAGLAVAAYIAGNAIGRGEFTLSEAVVAIVTVVAAYVVGIYFGTRAAYVESLHAHADQMARERELLAQRAVAEERVRIARELHDVVAHHLSLITVQAAALQTQLPAGGSAHAAAESMAATGRRALDEMRRMLGVLRLGSAPDAPGRTPQPGIDDIAALVEQAQQAGLDVRLRVSGSVRAVPDGVDLSVYRIVQEALTNVIRHAGDARCEVTLDHGSERMVISVVDDGPGVVAGSAGSGGQGLVGMRERVALLEGTMSAGQRAGGGFAVEVTLPLPAPARVEAAP